MDLYAVRKRTINTKIESNNQPYVPSECRWQVFRTSVPNEIQTVPSQGLDYTHGLVEAGFANIALRSKNSISVRLSQ